MTFEGSGQTCPRHPKYEVGNIFAINLEKSVATVFVFCFCFVFVMQSIEIFYWFLVTYFVTFLLFFYSFFHVFPCINAKSNK